MRDELDFNCGVYCFTLKGTSKRYVGSSNNIRKRLTNHASQARCGNLSCLYKSIRKYGMESFELTLLEECEQSRLLEREKFWIDFYGSAESGGLNTHAHPTATYSRKISDVTRKRIGDSSRGRRHSRESKIKISLALKGRKHSAETIAKISLAKKGKAPSREQVLRTAEFNRGKKRSPETIAKFSKSMMGHHVSEETRKKLSIANSGYKHTDEAKRKMSIAKRNISDETRKLMSAVHRNISDETRLKMSESAKRRKRAEVDTLAGGC